MEEKATYNGFEMSEYTEELYRDAKANAQRKHRLQRRLENLEKRYTGTTPEQQETVDRLKLVNLKYQMKQQIFKAGMEYYRARAMYCYYLAENAYEREFKIWNDIMLDFMAELDRCTENKTESPM